jgi:DNA-binding NtrC family response regulator
MKTARIFIADDDIIICALLVKILASLHCSCHCAHSVRQSLSILITNSFYDVYLLDYILQDGTGLEIAHFLRSRECQKPIIFVSGSHTGELEAEVEALQILSVIQKPFTAQTIRSKVGEALGRPA